MLRRSTVLLVVIFLLLLGFIAALQQGWFSSSPQEPTATPQAFLLDGFLMAQVENIQVFENQQLTLDLKRTPDGGWIFTLPAASPADPGKVEQLLSSLSALTAASQVSPGTALEALGITPDGKKLVMVDQMGGMVTLHLGNSTPTGTGYFVQVNQKPPLVVSQYAFQDVISLANLEALQLRDTTP